MNTQFGSSTQIEIIFLPLINCPAEDFRLRGEAEYLFGSIGIKAVEQLPFIKQFELTPEALSKNSLHFILYDHNELTDNQKHLAPYVVGVLDHHKDTQTHTSVGTSNYYVSKVGSCCSHLVNIIAKRNHISLLDLELCELLLAVILLDTQNFSKEYDKATPQDVFAKDALINRMLELKHQKYRSLRTDVSNLDTPELLRKDRKVFSFNSREVQISSVPLSTSEWLKRDPNLFGQLCCAYESNQNHINAMLIMTMYNSEGHFRRDLIVVLPKDRDLQSASQHSNQKINSTQMISMLESSDLKLIPIPIKNSDVYPSIVRAYHQANISIDRKQLAPLVGSIVSKL